MTIRAHVYLFPEILQILKTRKFKLTDSKTTFKTNYLCSGHGTIPFSVYHWFTSIGSTVHGSILYLFFLGKKDKTKTVDAMTDIKRIKAKLLIQRYCIVSSCMEDLPLRRRPIKRILVLSCSLVASPERTKYDKSFFHLILSKGGKVLGRKW